MQNSNESLRTHLHEVEPQKGMRSTFPQSVELTFSMIQNERPEMERLGDREKNSSRTIQMSRHVEFSSEISNLDKGLGSIKRGLKIIGIGIKRTFDLRDRNIQDAPPRMWERVALGFSGICSLLISAAIFIGSIPSIPILLKTILGLGAVWYLLLPLGVVALIRAFGRYE